MKTYRIEMVVDGKTELKEPCGEWMAAEMQMIALLSHTKGNGYVAISEVEEGVEKEVVRMNLGEPIQMGPSSGFHLYLRSEYQKAKHAADELRKDQELLVRHIDLLDRYELLKHLMRRYESMVPHNFPQI